MNRLFPFTLVAALVFAAPNLRADDDEHDGGGGGGTVRIDHDVRCSLFVAGGAAVTAGGAADVAVVVRNRSRRAPKNVSVAVYANAATGTPLWTGSLRVDARHRAVRRVSLLVPADAASLVAVALCDRDDNPGNNMDSVPVTGGTPSATPIDPAVLAGAATYASNCASCHGADGGGTRLGPRVAGRSAGDIYEAMREGEDGMPVFLGLSRTDATNLARFLADPSAATAPPPVDPPPAPSNPTYGADVKPLLDASCVVCHTGAGAPKNVRLENYTVAKSNASAALAAMQAGTMPPGNPASAAEIKLLGDWIAGGKQQ